MLANNVDPDQMQHYVASDLGLHCLSMILLCVTRSEWIIELCLLKANYFLSDLTREANRKIQ